MSSKLSYASMLTSLVGSFVCVTTFEAVPRLSLTRHVMNVKLVDANLSQPHLNSYSWIATHNSL